MKRTAKNTSCLNTTDLILTKRCADVDSIKYKYMWDNILILYIWWYGMTHDIVHNG